MVPTVVHWMVNTSCNYSCDFCYKPELPLINSGDRLWILDKIKDAGVRQVTLTGGEATLALDFTSLLEYGSKLGLKMALHTNGSMLSEEKLMLWAPFLGGISFGLESSLDELRAKDHFQRTLRWMKLASQLNIHINVQSMISAKNINELPKLAEVLLEYLKPESLWFLSEFAPLRNAASATKYLLPDGEFKAAIAKLPSLPFRVWNKTKEEIEQTPYFFIGMDGSVFSFDRKQKMDINIGHLQTDVVSDLWIKINNCG